MAQLHERYMMMMIMMTMMMMTTLFSFALFVCEIHNMSFNLCLYVLKTLVWFSHSGSFIPANNGKVTELLVLSSPRVRWIPGFFPPEVERPARDTDQ